MTKWMLLCAAILGTSGCTTLSVLAPEPVPVESSCAAFKILHPSRLDTSGTKRQILEHNTVYRRVCEEKLHG
jgi:hypothetical protein